MNNQNVYTDVMEQARRECAPDLPENANESQIAAMVAHHGFLICEHGQDTLEATEALLAQDVARNQLWGYPTPYKPEGYQSADHMIYTLVTKAGRNRDRLCRMRAVGVFCEYAEWHGIETDAAVRNWTNCREVYSHLRNAAKADNLELLQAILSDVVTIKNRDEIREKYKSTPDKPKAGVGRLFCVDGQQYFLARITDGERAAPGLGKLFDLSKQNGFDVISEAMGDQIKVVTFRLESLDDLWTVEPELETVPR